MTSRFRGTDGGELRYYQVETDRRCRPRSRVTTARFPKSLASSRLPVAWTRAESKSHGWLLRGRGGFCIARGRVRTGSQVGCGPTRSSGTTSSTTSTSSHGTSLATGVQGCPKRCIQVVAIPIRLLLLGHASVWRTAETRISRNWMCSSARRAKKRPEHVQLVAFVTTFVCCYASC
eukprot:1389361-Rhodomonas_salina.3